ARHRRAAAVGLVGGDDAVLDRRGLAAMSRARLRSEDRTASAAWEKRDRSSGKIWFAQIGMIGVTA
ncbi:MAG TPA: hypothetical protein PKN67_06495, partial [Pseudomonadales bacterium]|nr:hypothetical protein [Pseudomonadales bacterium]